MAHVKPYQRVERVIRDVPASPMKGKANYVVGVNVTNAQQIVHDRMEKSLCACARAKLMQTTLMCLKPSI